MVKFTVKNDGQVVDITVKNEVIQGKIKITKVDTNNNPIQNATFQILDSSKNVVQTISTDENGFAISDTLNIGTYYYKEVSAPEEYIVDDTEQQFEITSSGDFVERTVEDKLKSSKLILHKVNKDTSENMADVRFEILDSNKNIIGSVVTDQNGYAESENLSVGTYYFKEVAVPSNFVQDTNEYQFEITDSNSNVEKTVYNVMKKLPVTGSLFSTDVIIVIVISVSCILLYVINDNSIYTK